MSNTPRFNLPLIAAAQAQKHVTHNEALVILDAVIHLAVESRAIASPPSSPTPAVRYLVPASPSGAWTGHAGAIAAEDSGSWSFFQPQAGWSAYVRDEAQLIVFNGTAWSPILVNKPAKAVFGSLAVGPQADSNNFCEVRKDQDGLTDLRVVNGNTTNNAVVRVTQVLGRPNAYTITDIRDNSGNPYWQLACGAGLTDAYFDMPRYHFRDTSGSEFVTIASSGNVGIGTTNPRYKYHLMGMSDAPSLTSVAGIASFDTNSSVALIMGGYTSSPNGFWLQVKDNQNNGAGLYGAFPLLLNPAGRNVGIGTASPNGKLDVAGNVLPHTDNSYSLGTGTYRWSVVYAGTGAINTSDARQKTPVRPLDEREQAAARDLRNEIGTFQFLDAVAKKGADKARLHIGMTVQSAIAIMERHGLDPWRYAMFCRDDVTIKKAVKRTESVPTKRVVEETYLDIELRDGKPVRVKKTRVVEEPVFNQIPIVDEDGHAVVEMRPSSDESGKPLLSDDGAPILTAVPILHPVPVMEDIEVEVEVEAAAGDRLGFRTDQLLLFMLRGLA